MIFDGEALVILIWIFIKILKHTVVFKKNRIAGAFSKIMKMARMVLCL